MHLQCSKKHAVVGEAKGYDGSPWTREHLGVKDKLCVWGGDTLVE